MRTKAGTKAPYFDYHAEVDVEVEISPDDLHRDGWHHDTECDTECKHKPEFLRPLILNGPDPAEVIASLHRQAHPNELDSPALCREEPCRSLSFAEMNPRMGRAS